MSNDILNEKEEKAKNQILSMEQESITNIERTDDKIMIAKIMKLYEDVNK